MEEWTARFQSHAAHATSATEAGVPDRSEECDDDRPAGYRSVCMIEPNVHIQRNSAATHRQANLRRIFSCAMSSSMVRYAVLYHASPQLGSRRETNSLQFWDRKTLIRAILSARIDITCDFC